MQAGNQHCDWSGPIALGSLDWDRYRCKKLRIAGTPAASRASEDFTLQWSMAFFLGFPRINEGRKSFFRKN